MSGGAGAGGELSWERCFSPADYIKYNNFSVVISSQKMFKQLWGWGRTLLPLDSGNMNMNKEDFKQLEELILHSVVNPNPRAQQSILDFPWPHCLAVMQPCGCSSFVSKRVLRSVQRPTGTVKWPSPPGVAACGEPLTNGHRVQRRINGKGQDAFLSHNVKGFFYITSRQVTSYYF